VLEDLGGPEVNLPIPNSFPQDQEKREFSYTLVSTGVDGGPHPDEGRWASGASIDGRGEFTVRPAEPLGGEPQLSSPAAVGYAQTQQIEGGPGQSKLSGSDTPEQHGGGLADKLKDAQR
jgi:Mn-containing catalase